MNNSNNNHLNILDLPNEILLIIFKKLNMVDVFYSLVNINQRLDRLVLNPLYIRDLNMTNMTFKSAIDQTFSVDNQVLSRIYEEILPRICHQVNKLTVEPHSMERILRAMDYPQLYSLTLINFETEMLLQYLKGDRILRNLLINQITHLNIDIANKERREASRTVTNTFHFILSACERLIHLNFCDLFFHRKIPILVSYLSSSSCRSSTLNILKINVMNFNDCLYLLDGHFDCLSSLIIYILRISYKLSNIDNTKKLPKLKCFSLTTFDSTVDYNNLIVPLLRRMINLDELKLYLPVIKYDSTYIDGIQLYEEILIYMTQLKKFTFSIKTTVFNKSIELDLQSNEDIQYSFIGRGYQQIGSFVQQRIMKREGKCHIYSLPYDFEYFTNLDNSFQGGMFHKVRYLSMADNSPFEHKLFKLISQDLPFLEFLYIRNDQPQKDKQHSFTLITFPHLTRLNLPLAHVDYVEQFLLKKNIHLPHLLNLYIGYESLVTLTNNFTENATYFNFDKLKCLAIDGHFVRPKNFENYFPL